MRVEVLSEPPISGSVIETHFDCVGDCTWVTFEPDSGGAWAGAFGDGRSLPQARLAVPFGDDRTVLVVAGGQGYVVDAVERRLLWRTDQDSWCGATGIPGRCFIVATDGLTLTAIGRDGIEWRSDRISRDDVVLDCANQDVLHGKVWWEDGWYAFTLHYEGWHFERGEWLTNDWSAFASASA